MTQVRTYRDETDRSRLLHENCGGSVTLVNGRSHCHRCESTDDNAGWRKKVLLWNWHEISLDGFPGWDLEGEVPRRHPPFVRIAIVKDRDKPSADIANEWDDIAEGLFYCRDWTDDGIPFVRDGETYWAGFWFQKATDRIRFLEHFAGSIHVAEATPNPA